MATNKVSLPATFLRSSLLWYIGPSLQPFLKTEQDIIRVRYIYIYNYIYLAYERFRAASKKNTILRFHLYTELTIFSKTAPKTKRGRERERERARKKKATMVIVLIFYIHRA